MRTACFGVLIAAAVTCSDMALGQDLVFDIDQTVLCLAQQQGVAGGATCIGRASGACMTDTQGGGSTAGMVGCLDLELVWWDGQLNQAYKALRTKERAMDAEYGTEMIGGVSRADALRDMQRAWIAYRDSTCDYERIQWGGGTGGGPATLSCLLDKTGRQALYLQEMLEVN